MREAQWDAANNVWKCCQRTVVSRCLNCPYADITSANRRAERPPVDNHPDDTLASREIVAKLSIDRMLCLRIGERRAVQKFVAEALDDVFDRYLDSSYDKITLSIEKL
jgi:hypothetical protein